MPRLWLARARAIVLAISSIVILQAAHNPQEVLLQVVINNQTAQDFVPILQGEGGRFLAPEEFFTSSRLRVPAVAPVEMSGRKYYPLDAIPGSHCTLDTAQQALRLSVPASAFVSTAVEGSARVSATPETSQTGLFLNHDFLLSGQAGNSGQGNNFVASGLVEAGLFSPWGVLTSQFVARNLVAGAHAVRLTTSFSEDFPNRMETLTIGDSVSASAPWARQVYYGGIRWGSNFSTQPSFIPQSLPSMQGEAVLPSTVDIFADNVQRLSTTVQPGPFSINNVPVLTGQGTISMVVTDIMGRQTLITQSYTSSVEVLRKGVQDYTYEGGSIRHNYGLVSSGYQGFFGAATYRRGITDSLTINGRAEVYPGGETAGAGFDIKVARLIMGGGVASSLSHGREGTLFYGEASHSSRILGFSANYQAANNRFNQLGLVTGQKPDVSILQTSLDRSLTRRVSLSGGYIERVGRTTQDVRAVSTSLNVELRRVFLTFAANRSVLKDHSILFSMTMSVPISRKTIASESLQSTGGTPTSVTEVIRQTGMSNGYGYLGKVDTGAKDLEMDYSYQNNQGLSTIALASADGEFGWRLEHYGGTVFMGGHLLASRWLTDSFAVVEMPASGVEVSANNQPVGKTGSNGTLLVPWLAPYQQNPIQVNEDALPMDITLPDSRRTVVPMPRSGEFVKFTTAQNKAVIVRLELPDGQPVPAGASVSMDGGPEQWDVTLHGQVMIERRPTPPS